MTYPKCKIVHQIISKRNIIWDESEDEESMKDKLECLKKEYYGEGFKIKKKKC